jgi:nicotinic acid mononucleotide adenylyltransferase
MEMSKQKGGAVQTYDLIGQLQKKYEWATFIFVMGGDVMHTIHTWGNSDKLQQENPFIIFNRKGYEIPVDKLPPKSTVI